MKQVASLAGLGNNCIFTGPKTLALKFNQEADVLLSPRVVGTNTPLKIYEQLASGKPLVATAIWSHSQVLTDGVCFLVEPTPDSIAEGILRALNDGAEAGRSASAAMAWYDRDYARPIYEEKIRALLVRVGFLKD
ncbi:MAG: glycosyltransferase [Pseudomonadota bacterium]